MGSTGGKYWGKYWGSTLGTSTLGQSTVAVLEEMLGQSAEARGQYWESTGDSAGDSTGPVLRQYWGGQYWGQYWDSTGFLEIPEIQRISHRNFPDSVKIGAQFVGSGGPRLLLIVC